jgi:hypothetical protein
MSKHGTFDPNRTSGNRNYTQTKRFNLKEGSNLYRVLPPFGSLSQSGEIAKYWSVYWLTDSNNRKRAVPTIFKKAKDGRVIQNDPIKDKLDAMTAMVDQAEKNGENPAVVEQMRKKLSDYNLDKAYYLNALSPSGEIGVLKIRYTAYQALLEKLKKLAQDGIDAINAGQGNGVFFDFRKVKDEKNRTSYAVDVGTRTQRDPMSNKVTVEYLSAPIDDVVLGRMESEARDLGAMYQYKSIEEMAVLATLDPAAVSRIYARPDKVEVADEAADDADEVDTAMPTVLKANGTAQFGLPPQSSPVAVTTNVPSAADRTIPTPIVNIAQQIAQTVNTVTKPAVSVLDNEDVKKFLFAGSPTK